MMAMIWLAACAPSLQETDDSDPIETDAVDTDVAPPDLVWSEDAGGGVTWVQVTALTETEMVRVQFGNPDEALPTDAWDVGWMRYTAFVNEPVAIVDGGFDALTVAPADGYGIDEGEVHVMDDWFDYDESSHVLTPKPLVYVFHRGESYWKLEMLDYYDDSGNSAYPTFRYAPVGAP